MTCAYSTKMKYCQSTYKVSKKLRQKFAVRGRFMYDSVAYMHLRALLLWYLTSFNPRGEVKGWDVHTVNKLVGLVKRKGSLGTLRIPALLQMMRASDTEASDAFCLVVNTPWFSHHNLNTP